MSNLRVKVENVVHHVSQMMTSNCSEDVLKAFVLENLMADDRGKVYNAPDSINMAGQSVPIPVDNIRLATFIVPYLNIFVTVLLCFVLFV
ncbi:MAG: hypothetical protein EOP48_13830 [Sphingobacteriales bacterium]|nr:MAG: hypothetical protein EOP48_13830 [Sphingobacteriales bacterium]